jgi:peptidoglycan/xylan/chitin deacetylase (PgdA/CDA1 family)
MRRISNRWRRFAVEHFERREFRLPGDVAYVSFTFDDFPRSALTEGGRILTDHGVRGTYFVSFRLLDTNSASGTIASIEDLKGLLREGHELGCHTFDHVDGTVVTAAEFERSIEANRAALAASGIGARFEVFAYPLNGPAVDTKKFAGRRFAGCRGGGQTFNCGKSDFNLLKAYFLDQRTLTPIEDIKRLINENAAAGGWLIFATHDVANTPSLYGCTPEYLDGVVRLSLASGARVLPMTGVCRELGSLTQHYSTQHRESA